MTVDKELDSYGGDPDHPITATGQIYPVHVNHGYLRYAKKDEHGSLVFWEDELGSWIGLPFFAAVFLWLLYRPEQPWPPRL